MYVVQGLKTFFSKKIMSYEISISKNYLYIEQKFLFLFWVEPIKERLLKKLVYYSYNKFLQWNYDGENCCKNVILPNKSAHKCHNFLNQQDLNE